MTDLIHPALFLFTLVATVACWLACRRIQDGDRGHVDALQRRATELLAEARRQDSLSRAAGRPMMERLIRDQERDAGRNPDGGAR